MTTEEDIWAEDLLNRKDDAEFIKTFLLNRIEERGRRGLPKSYVLNIDAGWGSGKTFFLKRLKADLEISGYLTAYVNAWQDDHADDPLIAVMSAIDEVVKPFLTTQDTLQQVWNIARNSGLEIALGFVKGAFSQGVKKLAGVAPQELLPEANEIIAASVEEGGRSIEDLFDRNAQNLLSNFQKTQWSTALFRNSISQFLSDLNGAYKDNGNRSKTKYKAPLFVLVDELDRCRPSYAINLLERIKHLFEIDNVVFIVATDSRQLKHSINAVYGLNFDSGRYLYRFFDRTYVFEECSLQDYVRFLFAKFEIDISAFILPDGEDIIAYVSNGLNYYGLKLRDAEQCIDILRSIITRWSYGVPVHIAFIFPLIIAFQQYQDTRLEKSKGNLDRLIVGPERLWGFSYVADKFEDDPFNRKPAVRIFKNYHEMFCEYINQSSLSIATLLSKRANDWLERWLSRQYNTEFEVIHRRNSSNSSPAPTSLISQYPELVRSAGRLLPKLSALHEDVHN